MDLQSTESNSNADFNDMAYLELDSTRLPFNNIAYFELDSTGLLFNNFAYFELDDTILFFNMFLAPSLGNIPLNCFISTK